MTHEEIRSELFSDIKKHKPHRLTAYWPKQFRADIEKILAGKDYTIVEDNNLPFGSTHFKLTVDTNQFETIDLNH
jgi:hypothetical protein